MSALPANLAWINAMGFSASGDVRDDVAFAQDTLVVIDIAAMIGIEPSGQLYGRPNVPLQ